MGMNMTVIWIDPWIRVCGFSGRRNKQVGWSGKREYMGGMGERGGNNRRAMQQRGCDVYIEWSSKLWTEFGERLSKEVGSSGKGSQSFFSL